MLTKKKKRPTIKRKKKNEELKENEKKNAMINGNTANNLDEAPGPSKSTDSFSITDYNICPDTVLVIPPCNHCKQVKRIFSPFCKFQTNRKPGVKRQSRPVIESKYFSQGLTCKEKSYLVSCIKSNRYQELKDLAQKAIRDKKIFTIYSQASALRVALVGRGWVEKLPSQRMNLNKIRQGKFSSKSNAAAEMEKLLLSGMVENHIPNFIWTVNEGRTVAQNDISPRTLINRLNIDGLWTTKQGLSGVMRFNYWYYIEDVSEVWAPRTYIGSASNGEIEEFVNDFKLTACTSLLKWVLSMVANDKPVFLSCGKIALNVIVFALNRCKEFLFRKQNKDIDKINWGNSTTPVQWNTFLKKYYRIIAKQDIFQEDRENKLPLYMGYAKLLLKEIYKIRPQLSCEGCHNIWIIKPSHNSRGRGIRISSKLGVITDLLRKSDDSKFVLQKYIEEPLLIHKTKFDIRQYYLITSTYPLVIWMYQDCYLKFSSQEYNLKNYHESIHLTNNAIQRHYMNCEGRHPELPQHNMWHSDTYKEYLVRTGKEKIWDSIIYPGMKRAIIAVLLTCQEQINATTNRFELYGCDFILDREYRPWLIEMNSCPDLSPTTPVTARICPEVLTDTVKVVIDHSATPGKFECIYRQPITKPRYESAVKLCVRGKSLPNEYFYRGKVRLPVPYLNNVSKDKDINVIMNRLRDIFDRDVMKNPNDDDLDIRNCAVCKPNNKGNIQKNGYKQCQLTNRIDILKQVKSVSEASTNTSCHNFIEHCLRSVQSFAPPPKGVIGKGVIEFSKLDDKSSVDSSLEDNENYLHEISSEEPIQEKSDTANPELIGEDGVNETKYIQEESGHDILKPITKRNEKSKSSDFFCIQDQKQIRVTLPEPEKTPSKNSKGSDFFYIRSTSDYKQPSDSSSINYQKTPRALSSNISLSVREATMKLFDYLDRKHQEFRKSR